MALPDDYILVTGSHNLNDDSGDSDTRAPEDDETSLHVLERQGISILDEKELPIRTEPRDQLSRELMDQGGIEIISSDEEESFL